MENKDKKSSGVEFTALRVDQPAVYVPNFRQENFPSGRKKGRVKHV